MRHVRIKNGETLVASAIQADRYFLRLRGLIGRTLSDGEGLLLSPCNQIHTCFMAYPIDAVYLDKEGIVLRVDRAVPAGKICSAQKGARRVLELPAGNVDARGIRIGEKMEVD